MSGLRRPGPAAREEDYERAGLDGHLAPGRSPALLLVDPARAYVDSDCRCTPGSNRPWRP